MDETVRIYQPKNNDRILFENVDKYAEQEPPKKAKKPKKESREPSHVVKRKPEKNSKWKFWTDGGLWKDVVNEQSAKVRELGQKYTFAGVLYNWLFVVMATALFVSFGVWGVNIHVDQAVAHAEENTAAIKDAEYQAIEEQREADKRAEEQSLMNQMRHNAEVKARIAYGSRNFIDVYNYSDADFMTLYQCIDNRLKNAIYEGMTIDEIAEQENQWVGYFKTNPVEDYYFNLALKSEEAKQNRISEPVGTDYIYTIYTPHGLYLTNDPKAPQYTYWRCST